MIKSNVKKVLSSGFVSAMLIGSGTLLSASYNSSLVGIEGGYSSIESEVSTPYTQNTTGMANVGLKVGAESTDFRVFLGGRYYFADDKYDSLATYGIDIQYKFNISDNFNAFIGGSAGMANAKFNVAGEPFSRTISDPYYGGDLGFNIHMGKNVDLELGGRYLSLDALNSKSGVDYTFNNIITGYASIIFKYQLD